MAGIVIVLAIFQIHLKFYANRTLVRNRSYLFVPKTVNKGFETRFRKRPGHPVVGTAVFYSNAQK